MAKKTAVIPASFRTETSSCTLNLSKSDASSLQVGCLRSRNHRYPNSQNTMPGETRRLAGELAMLELVCWALYAAVECHLDTVEHIGSNPIAPTIFEVPRLRSGFRLRARTPANRLKFESYSAHHLRGPSASLGISAAGPDAANRLKFESYSAHHLRGPSASLGISAAGSNARKSPQVRIL